MKKVDKAWQIAQPDNTNIAAMLEYGPKYYQARIQKLGFTGQDRILLDAGCGAGHWSIGASYLNKKVYGIDLTKKYLSYAETLKNKLHRQNIELRLGNIEKLPYKGKFFDYIICYSVWMFTDKEKTLQEFYRVLKPGGKIYLGSLIGPSWYPKLIFQGLIQGNRSLILQSLRAIFHGIPVSSRNIFKMLAKNGFKILQLSSDGDTGNNKIKVKPIYNGKRWGMWEVFEVLAIKDK